MEILLNLKGLLWLCLIMTPYMWLAMLTSYGKHKTGPPPNKYDWAWVTLIWPAFLATLGGVLALSWSINPLSIEKLSIGLLLLTWGVLLVRLLYRLMDKSEKLKLAQGMLKASVRHSQ